MAKHRAPARRGNPPRDGLVEILLEYHGTPMHHLFEYPYNEHESRKLISEAKATVTRLLAELEAHGKKKKP